MKILMLTPYLPYPLISGGQIRSYNLLKILAKKHQITLVALIKHEDEKNHIKNISRFCHKVIVARRPEKPWTLSNIVKTGLGKYPFLVVRNYSSDAKQAVISELAHATFDLIHAETFYVMPHIPQTKVPILLVEQTIEYLVYKHFVETLKIPPVRWLFGIDVEKIRIWEEYFWSRATRVVAMSDADRELMRSRINGLEVSIVPNGVDTRVFTFTKRELTFSPIILFVGNFKWLQNKEAVIDLAHNIWPTIAKKLPQAKLWIVGRYPTPDIIRLKSERIEVSDKIEQINSAYEKSQVLLAPIYGPGGTRYKILEAMASGLPVVTTPQGIEGLGAKDYHQALVRRTASELAQATIKVLTNVALYNMLAENANQLVRKIYNWEVIADSLDQVYEEVAHEKKH